MGSYIFPIFCWPDHGVNLGKHEDWGLWREVQDEIDGKAARNLAGGLDGTNHEDPEIPDQEP